MTVTEAELRALTDQAAHRVMNKEGTKSGTRAGWLMISTILIEAWDLYSIAFLLIFIKQDFGDNPALVGLASGAVQLGALLGCFLGGWFADRFGRKKVFITTMILFMVLAAAQGFVTDLWQLALVRFLLGFPLGSDISSGYAYIMEAMPRGKREVMGNRWQGMFAVGEVIAILVITLMYVSGMDHSLLWRIGLALGAVPALALLIGRIKITDTALSLIQRGKFRQAKKVSMDMFGDPLDMLPDEDFTIARPSTKDFLKSIWAERTRRRASVFAWISNFCQGAEFGAFAFYLPTILVVVGISKNDVVATNILTLVIYVIAGIAGFIAPALTPRIGHRGISQWGFGLAFISLLLAALALWQDLGILLPISAAALMVGHYWDASNGMTITSMVAPTRYKGTASGFGYIFVKFGVFVTMFLFPIMLAAFGNAASTAIVSVISLAGFLAARYILPEVYGHVESDDPALAEREATAR
jgi:MFS family permease